MITILKLSEVCDIQSGGTPSRSKKEFWNGDIPWSKISDIEKSNGTLVETEERITNEGLKAIRNRIFKPGTLLFAMYGSVGKTAVAGIKVTTNQAILGITVKDDKKLDMSYLQHWLGSQQLNFDKDARGVAQKNLSAGYVRDLKIPLPPLKEQKRIAVILDKADAIRCKRQQAIDLTDQLLCSVFLDMFGDPVTNPKGLEVVKISEIGEIVTGSSPSRVKPEYYGNYIEWIKSGNINTPGHYLTKAEEYLSKEGLLVGRSVTNNSILVTCIAGSKDCIGNVAIADRAVSFNQQINAIVPNEKILTLFLYAQLAFNKKLVQRASTESMKGMVSKSKFSEIEILLPAIKDQEKYADFFYQTLNEIEAMKHSRDHANKLFGALTQQSFNGELRKKAEAA